jgi:hypothetical protein
MAEKRIMIVKILDENRLELLRMALQQYVGERCPYCMREFKTIEDLNEAVWNRPTEWGSIAHKSCWQGENQGGEDKGEGEGKGEDAGTV